MHQKLKKFTLLLAVFISTSSCTGLFLMKKNVAFEELEAETQVEQLVPVLEFWYYQPLKTKNGATLDPFKTDFYAFKYKKKGYFTEEVVKHKDRRHPGGVLDFLALTATPIVAQTIEGDEVEPLYPAVFGVVGLIDWLALRGRGLTKTYRGDIISPKLKEKPRALPGFKAVQLDEITWKKGFDTHDQFYYKNYEKFLAKKKYKELESKSKPRVSPAALANVLNSSLARQGFVDSTLKIYASNFTALSLKAEVVNVEEHFINGKVKYDISVRWKLHNNILDKTAYERVIRSSTIWGYNEYANWDLSQEMFEIALEKAMYKFIFSSEVTTYLLRDEDPLADLYYTWSKIDIGNNAKYARNLNEAKQAVHTLHTPEGHGTAISIGSNGYLVSNYHMVQGQAEDSIFIHFRNQVKLKAQVVRSNPIHDLCLLKVDSTFQIILQAKPRSYNNVIGSKVYAIASPTDPDLIQSISKGVISYERKSNNRVIIQSDVSVNRGSSGGALVDEQGRLLGLLNAKLTGYGVEGLSFSTPAYYLKESLYLR